MALTHEGEPVFDPEWERAALVGELQEAYRENIGLATIHVHDSIDSTEGVGASAVLAGLIEPSPYTSANYAGAASPINHELILLVYAGLQDRALHRAFFIASPPLSWLGRYDLYAPMDRLSQKTASMDALVRNRLARTHFDIHRSLEARDRLIGSNILKHYQGF